MAMQLCNDADFNKGIARKAILDITDIDNESINDNVIKVEKWWNNLQYDQKRHYEQNTFGSEWFEDKPMTFTHIETMYYKYN